MTTEPRSGTGDTQPARADAKIVTLRPSRASPPTLSPTIPPDTERVFFQRAELDRILQLYGRMVARGEWRDYAIDMLRERAVFSAFRRAGEVPLVRIEKHPRLARRQGEWLVAGAAGQILKRGHDLDRVLRILDDGPRLVRG